MQILPSRAALTAAAAPERDGTAPTREVLPNNPSIAKWIEKLKRNKSRGDA